MHLETRSNHAQHHNLCRDLRQDGMQLNNEMNALHNRRRNAIGQRDVIDDRLRTLRSELSEVATDLSQLGTPTRPSRRPGPVGFALGVMQFRNLRNRASRLKAQITGLDARRLDAVRAITQIEGEITRKEQRQAHIGRRRRALGCPD